MRQRFPARSLTMTLTMRQRIVHGLVCVALLCSLATSVGLPATALAAPDACPAAPGSLPDTVERTDFCVYFNDSNTTNAQATTVADHTQLYWDRFEDLGFATPLFSSKLEVRLTSDSDCNGSTGSSDNFMTVFEGCFGNAESIKKVTGHELFHRVQFAYDTDFGANWWMTEGTARAMEDNAFNDIDNWATSLTAVSSSFNKQVNQYLSNTNVDITSQPQRYNSALWWKYMTEQFGSTPGEPGLGVDALLRLWEAAETLDDIAAVNSALGVLSAGVSFDGAFRRFAAANYIKDLANPPSAQYNYVDEEQVGNPAVYGPLVPTNGGTISIGTSATFPDQSISRYGARYYRAQPDAANCPVVSARFHTDSGPAFFHVISQDGNNLDNFATSTATDYERAFFNDGLSRVVAIAGSTNNASQVDITLECVNPVMNIVLPNDPAVSHVGPFDGPGKFLAQVQVHNGDPKGPVVAGLTVNDFKAQVNGINALITAGAFIQEQYWLLIQAPDQVVDGNGVYDLEIALEKSGTGTEIASDTNTDSVSYDPDNVDHLLVIDRSGSMTTDNKMNAARAAAKFYVDITRLDDGLAVIPYNEDVSPAPFALREVTAVPNVRQEAKNYLDTITASGLTSIGDGMREAVIERNASPTSNPNCSYVLLSDGMENSAELWATVQADAITTGCPVTSIAFGSAADETLMQTIATVTGGPFFYNDVFTSGGASVAGVDATNAVQDTALGLGDIYEYAQGNSERRQRLLHEKGIVTFTGPTVASPVAANDVQTHTVMIDGLMPEALFALDWVPGRDLDLMLIAPSGAVTTPATLPYTFADFDQGGHVGWRIEDPEPGEWTLLVDFRRFRPGTDASATEADATDAPTQESDTHYQVLVSGPSSLTLDLLLPARLRTRYLTGQRVPLYAFLSNTQPISGVLPIAIVTAPNGVQSRIRLFDDGQHGDGDANDGFYAGLYTAVNQANPVAPVEPGAPTATPNDEGSYHVRLEVDGGAFQRQALGSFSVVEGPDDNSDGMPDPFEEENDISGDGSDPDLDDADNQTEYQLGTDPNNSDSDGGGENDGSEFQYGKNPLDPTDDEIVAPEFLHVTPGIGLNVVYYDVRPEYNQMRLYRSESLTGTWTLLTQELPTTGVYSDTADNDTTYYYRYLGVDADDYRSRVLDSVPSTPSTDPFAPQKDVVINNDAPTTTVLTVTLTMTPYGDHPEDNSPQDADVAEMRISNDLLQIEAVPWVPYAEQVPWELASTPPNSKATVYVQFRDAAENESLVVLDDIIVTAPGQLEPGLFLPKVVTEEPD